MLIIIFNIKEILLAKLTEAPEMWCPKKRNIYAFKSEGIIFPINCPFSVRTAFFPHALGNLNHVSFLLRYKSIEYPSVSVSLYWLLSVYCEVLCCRFFFVQIQPDSIFCLFFLLSSSPYFFFIGWKELLWQYWVLDLWAQQVSLSDGLPLPRTYCTLV